MMISCNATYGGKKGPRKRKKARELVHHPRIVRKCESRRSCARDVIIHVLSQPESPCTTTGSAFVQWHEFESMRGFFLIKKKRSKKPYNPLQIVGKETRHTIEGITAVTKTIFHHQRHKHNNIMWTRQMHRSYFPLLHAVVNMPKRQFPLTLSRIDFAATTAAKIAPQICPIQPEFSIWVKMHQKSIIIDKKIKKIKIINANQVKMASHMSLL